MGSKLPAAFSTILVTTDLSPLGDAALPIAVRLARDHSARLIVLSVVELPPPPNPLYAHYYPIPSLDVVEEARQQVRARIAERLPDDLGGVVPEILVEDGAPATEIARVANEQEASLLVIATRGRTGFGRFLLGSVTAKVLESTQCPVLLVR